MPEVASSWMPDTSISNSTKPSVRLQSFSREAVFIFLLQNYTLHDPHGMTVTWQKLDYLRFLLYPDGYMPTYFLKNREK